MKENTESKPPKYICKSHQQKAYFFCHEKCNIFLCQQCLLSHKQHCDNVILVDELLKNVQMQIQQFNVDQIKLNLLKRQQENFENIQKLSDSVFSMLQENKAHLHKEYYQKNKKVTKPIEQIQILSKLNDKSDVKKTIQAAQKIIIYQREIENSKFDLRVEQRDLNKKFLQILRKNYQIIKFDDSFNTLNAETQVFLHWFQWEKREINLIDIQNLDHTNIKLITPFKTLPFSRSIMIPSGQIYLLGGEVTRSYNKTNFLFCVQNRKNDQSMYEKSPLLQPVYDFACVYYQGFIYLFGGKDKNKTVQNYCQVYNIIKNEWTMKKKSQIKRYAHSAFSIKEKESIYLVGGRDCQNQILPSQVEAYSIEKNEWEILILKLPSLQIPVEIPCSIQIESYKALIFGGLDKNFKQKKSCYIFDSKNFQLDKIQDLKEKSAFINFGIKKGNFVYALGNDLNMDKRILHEYDIKKQEWAFKRFYQLIFKKIKYKNLINHNNLLSIKLKPCSKQSSLLTKKSPKEDILPIIDAAYQLLVLFSILLVQQQNFVLL